ncbi:RNA-binding protein [Niveomyces insectorum RCEF 264]|uniref:RNA-binding protein n=1 Tax=Niveomyces insectorum RCEF 264 TaxID=1081102 RepID=A0A162JGN3_9HYPO|nr:RNA-binding protein [Niveomyces insectorum RCEF 264]
MTSEDETRPVSKRESMEINKIADTADGNAAATVSSSSSPPSSPAPLQKKRKAALAATTTLPDELEVDLSLPEPPSKRAKRALKKGKPLPAKPRSDEDEDDDEDDNKKTADATDEAAGALKTKKERSPYGVWIGNLAFTVTRPELFQWLVRASGGAIAEDAITRVNLPTSRQPAAGVRPHNKTMDNAATAGAANQQKGAGFSNKGFAYVDFATYAAQVAAVALSETELAGRRVLIKDSKSYAGRPTPAAAAGGSSGKAENGNGEKASATAAGATLPPGAATTKIFVGNLGFDTTEEDLRRHFAPCGPIAWAKVATFPDNTAKCRGYGWVQFGVSNNGSTTTTTATAEGGVGKLGSAQVAAAAAAAAAAAVQGFVRIKETVATEEDFVAEAAAAAATETETEMAEAEGTETERTETESVAAAAAPTTADQDPSTALSKAPAPQPPRTKMRKWWVNMFKGRPLKIQFAEDDHVRYKKRFGKARPQPGTATTTANDDEGNDNNDNKGGNNRANQPARRPSRHEQDGGGADGAKKPYKYQDLSIAQRTGAVTVSLGKKTILE